MELRREEERQELKCALCGKPLWRWDSDTIMHHTQYVPEEKTVYVCRSCHTKIHSQSEKYPELAPSQPPEWRRYQHSQDSDPSDASLEIPPVNTRELFGEFIDYFLKSDLEEMKIDFENQELARYYLLRARTRVA